MPSSTPRFHRSLVGAALVASAALTGCSSTMRLEGKVQLEGPLTLSEGPYVGREMFDRLEVGSDAMWAIALFGEPTQRTTLSDGSRVWRWTFRHLALDTSISPSLLSVGRASEDAGSDDEDARDHEPARMTITNTYVRVVDDRIDAKWRD